MQKGGCGLRPNAIPQALAGTPRLGLGIVRGEIHQHANATNSTRLLHARRERPRHSRSAIDG
jgi:hypothetical protein